MASEIEILEFLEEENESLNEKEEEKRRRRRMRFQYDPFSSSETEFVKRYRLTKSLAKILCEDLRPLMNCYPRRSTDLTLETKVCIALAFYANGSYQKITGDSQGHNVSQSTVSGIINLVTKCLNHLTLRNKYIHFPNTTIERNTIKSRFNQKFNIPGVLGCIDCTQVAIIRPTNNEERFFCRKHYHSLNVQIICDADMNILSVDASHGGATHDTFIWNAHPIKKHVEELSISEPVWFLGDSGYSQRKTMMTPILNTLPGSPEAHYTNLHIKARCTIERTIGVLKARFRCLLVHRVLHYTPEIAGSIVNACVILHNICNRANTPFELESLEDLHCEEESSLSTSCDVDRDDSRNNNIELQEGLVTRRRLVQRLWERVRD